MVGPAQERPPRAPVSPPGSSDFTAADFPADPELHCDIVMKGGITSGVVYPLAVCELATTYRLRSVGGPRPGRSPRRLPSLRRWAGARCCPTRPRRPPDTAGAPHTAIGATAPAPVPVPGALPRGFLGLAQFPKLLAGSQPDGRSLLFHLFRPQPGAVRLFGLLSAVLEQKTKLPDKPSRGQQLRAVLAVVAHATTKAPIRSLLGVVLGLALVVLGIVVLVGLPAGSHPVWW